MPSRVIPILRLAVLCESIELDKEGRPFFCVPVHTIQFPPGIKRNYQPPALHAYLQLQEALGTFNLKVLFRREKEEFDLFASVPVPIEFDGQNHQNVPLELDIELLGLVIPEPGCYEFWVVANHVNLHSPDHQPGWSFPPMKLNVFGPDGTEGGVL